MKRDIETRTDEQIPKFAEYTKEMIEKLMEDNLIEKQSAGLLSKKNKQEEKIDEKLIDLMIE